MWIKYRRRGGAAPKKHPACPEPVEGIAKGPGVTDGAVTLLGNRLRNPASPQGSGGFF